VRVVHIRTCMYVERRRLPADRRGACCFLLGMLLKDFPLDFSCRDQKAAGQAGEETKVRKSQPEAPLPRFFSGV